MKRHIHTLSILLISLLALGGFIPKAEAQTTDFAKLFALFKKSATFDYDFPREKVYLHLDNNAYMEGDTVWFKAYVVRASSLKPEPLSRVLYAELLNADGALVQRHLLRIDSLGGASGQFILNLPVRRGYYEIRAYTREMTNWGTDACFSRVVPIFERVENKEGEPELNIYKPEEASDLMPGHPRPYHFGKESERRLALYPEGGERVKGLTQVIAYKLTDGRGAACDDVLHILSNGQEITQSKPEHEGMGSFVLPGNATDVAILIGKKTYELPEFGKEQYVLHAEAADGNGTTSVVIQRAADAKPTLLGLAVMCREMVCYFDTITVDAQAVQIDLPATAFHNGINRMELFDASGHSICRRLLWRDAEDSKLNFKVLQNKSAYDPFTPVAIEMYVKDAEGNPVETTFSLSVRDAKGQLTGSTEEDVKIDMLLSSELRGYVHQPDWYFKEDVPTSQRTRALDNLLLVQGWMTNRFEVVNGTEPFNLKQPIEDKLTLNGHIYKYNDKREPYADLSLSLKMYTKEGASLVGEARTDSLGEFAFQSNVDFCGNWIAHFVTRNDKEKKKWSRVALDRWFDVRPRTFDFHEFELTQPRTTLQAAEENLLMPETFEWEDTIEKFVATDIGVATVTKETKYKGLIGGRYSYNGGERSGMRKADIYYNIEQEVEKLKDRGEAVGSIWELLANLDKDFEYDSSMEGYDAVEESNKFAREVSTQVVKREGSSDPGVDGSVMSEENGPIFDYNLVTYKNRTIADIFMDNSDTNLLLESFIWADEIKSVVIMHGRSKWAGFASDLSKVGNGDDALFLYSRPNYESYKGTRGVERRMVQGYTLPLDFSAPSYNGLDLPNDADFRRTLYWNANVQTDSNGKATAVFYSNARNNGQISVTARGITADGRFIDFSN